MFTIKNRDFSSKVVYEYEYDGNPAADDDYSIITDARVTKVCVEDVADDRKKLDPANVAVYNGYMGVRGVVIPKGDGYRLIDGYHRFGGAKESSKFLIGFPNV